MINLITHPAHVIGLSILIKAAPETPSGFRPRPTQHDTPVFGMSRWDGFANALSTQMARKVTVVGGFEPLDTALCVDTPENRPHPTDPHITLVPRAYAAIRFLRQERGGTPETTDWMLSEGNTHGNYAAIAAFAQVTREPFVISASFFHIPRSLMIATQVGLGHVPHIPAEAFTFHAMMMAGMKRDDAMAMIADTFGGGDLARRAALEIAGTTDMLTGSYAPRSH